MNILQHRAVLKDVHTLRTCNVACPKKIRFNVTSTGVLMEQGHNERDNRQERVPDKEMHKAGRGAG